MVVRLQPHCFLLNCMVLKFMLFALGFNNCTVSSQQPVVLLCRGSFFSED